MKTSITPIRYSDSELGEARVLYHLTVHPVDGQVPYLFGRYPEQAIAEKVASVLFQGPRRIRGYEFPVGR